MLIQQLRPFIQWRRRRKERKALIKSTVNKHLCELAKLGTMSVSDSSVHAQVLPIAVRKDLMAAGLLNMRGNAPVVAWTAAGLAACGDAKRELRRQQNNRSRNGGKPARP